MLSLKTLAILFLPGALAAVFWAFGGFGALLKKGNVVLERMLPPKVSAILMKIMWFLVTTDIEWKAPDHSDEPALINPATGLPMVGAVDVAGNSYGSSGHEDRDEY